MAPSADGGQIFTLSPFLAISVGSARQPRVHSCLGLEARRGNSGHRSVRSDSQGGQRHWSPEGPQLTARGGSAEDTGVWWRGCQSGVLSKYSWATDSAMVPPAWLPLVAAHL